ncbi:AraC family transcriptional regulator [Streptomyces sp. W16]|uniref:helix-turn-helix domain-containing protein n=1 Tax=Streptomyces sp. W16 TaxID=3076631 RepID=UPI00295BA12B|nr:AraC family transcriptional regulator [Streptomyces sp. W16]MDV9172846.1 AraC family transcriptional regulator [Streptomyces sp. W16]
MSAIQIARAGGLWRLTRPWHPGLRPFLRSCAGYWDAVTSPYEARLVPSGRATLVISLAEPFSEVRRLGMPGGGSGRIGSLVVGLEDRPAICVHPGGQEAIRVEFTPLGAYRLFGIPMSELTNLAVEIRDVLGPEAETLVDRMAATQDWTTRFDLLDGALLARLGRGPEPAPEVTQAWRLLAASAGTIPISRIAAEVGWSQGYLIRRFTQQIGLTPKSSARVLRFRRAVTLLGHGNTTLTQISTTCGFYDQAHLNREFRAIAGTTPGQMLAARRVEGALAVPKPRATPRPTPLSLSANSSKTGPVTTR